MLPVLGEKCGYLRRAFMLYSRITSNEFSTLSRDSENGERCGNDESDVVRFGRIVLEQRKAARLTQENVADAAFGNPDRRGYVSRVEQGDIAGLTPATAQNLCRALDIPHNMVPDSLLWPEALRARLEARSGPVGNTGLGVGGSTAHKAPQPERGSLLSRIGVGIHHLWSWSPLGEAGNHRRLDHTVEFALKEFHKGERWSDFITYARNNERHESSLSMWDALGALSAREAQPLLLASWVRIEPAASGFEDLERLGLVSIEDAADNDRTKRFWREFLGVSVFFIIAILVFTEKSLPIILFLAVALVAYVSSRGKPEPQPCRIVRLTELGEAMVEKEILPAISRFVRG